MLIVGCQVCGEVKVLAGTPDLDGIARVRWACPKCGAGQVLQLGVSRNASGGDLRRILGGFSLPEGESDWVAGQTDEMEGPEQAIEPGEETPLGAVS